MIKLKYGIDWYNEPVAVIDEETGEEKTEWAMKSRPAIYEAAKAVKGSNYVHLYNATGGLTASFEGISDFAGYELLEGEWSSPEPESPSEADRLSALESAMLAVMMGGAASV